MLEKMKWALSRLSVMAASWTQREFKEALLCMARGSDENTADIVALKLKIEAMQRENANAKLAARFAYCAMLDHHDCPEQVRAIIREMMALSEGRNHG